MAVKAARARPRPGLNVARETAPARAKRARAIARALDRTYPDAWCELDYRTPWELLVATILSAQCTDKMVNQVTPALFAAYPTTTALAAAPAADVEALIKRTGFFRQKTKSIQSVARAVADSHGGEVPSDMDALTKLPGVGRKTANVVRGTAFGLPAIFVDTHVRRLANRLGLTVEDDPDKIEGDLQRLLPPRAWTAFAHRLIHHGRRVCAARKPRCSGCALRRWCPQIGVTSAA
ncbi:MAG TPA: endonuclease III [Candidatus Eisenbacteria bacterium]|nr:endonuclease III [Candidatus Eisenbacteria bacterium]